MKSEQNQKEFENTKDSESFELHSVQRSDYEALCWIRDNTPADTVIVSDRSTILNIDNYMYYGTFSERSNYLEGDRYFYGTYTQERATRREIIKELYANSTEALEMVKKAGVGYVVQTKWLTPEYTGAGTEKIFETESIAVWKII